MAATAQEIEEAIQAEFGGRYTEEHINGEANSVRQASNVSRMAIILDMDYKIFAPTVSNSSSPTAILQRYATMEQQDALGRGYNEDGTPSPAADFYPRAQNSFIYQITGDQTGDQRSELDALVRQANQATNVPKVDGTAGLEQRLQDEFAARVRAADLGDVADSQFDVDPEINRGWTWAGPNWGNRDRNAAATRGTEENTLWCAQEEFVWFAYNMQILNNGVAPTETAVFEAMDLDRYVQLYLEIKIRPLLVEAFEALAEAEEAGEVDGHDDEGNLNQEGREFLADQARQRGRDALVPEEAGSAAEQAQLKRLAEQSFLVDFLPEFAVLNQDRASTYENYFWMLHGHTDTIMNKLLYNPAFETLDTLRPSEISGLVPQIRLFKVEYATEGNSVEYEIPFASHIDPADIQAMMGTSFDRGRGAGLKSFDWTLHGRDPFTARRDIFGELKLYFQSFDELLRPRAIQSVDSQHTNSDFTYMELVNFAGPGTVRHREDGSWNPEYYRLRVEVGWADPGTNNSFLGSGAEKSQKQRAIVESRSVMYLTANDHTIDISDEGIINLTISYIAYQEASYMDNNSDILATEHTRQRRLDRRADLAAAAEACDTRARERILRDYTKEFRREKYNSFQRILGELYDDRSIKYVSVPVGTLESYINYGEQGVNIRGLDRLFGAARGGNQQATFDVRTAAQQTGLLMEALGLDVGSLDETEITEAIQNLTYGDTADNGNVRVQFFYLGDLIRVALRNISTSTQGAVSGLRVPGKLDRNLRILLGPITFKRRNCPADPTEDCHTEILYNINLADIPIAVNLYVEWFLRTAVGRELDTYPILAFLRDLANSLITSVIRDQSHGLTNVPRQSLKLRSNFITAAATAGGADVLATSRNILPASSGGTDYTRIDVDGTMGATLRSGRPLLRSPVDNERAYHYMALYALNLGTTQPLGGHLEDRGGVPGDRARGIYHFAIAKDRGIFKTVRFTKAGLPSAREARIVADLEQTATGLILLKNVYNVDVKTVGNALFVPGMKIYIDPAGISPSMGSPNRSGDWSNILGIGGYHVITQVQSFIEGGKFETTIKAIFEGAGVHGAIGFTGEVLTEESDNCPDRVQASSILRGPSTSGGAS